MHIPGLVTALFVVVAFLAVVVGAFVIAMAYAFILRRIDGSRHPGEQVSGVFWSCIKLGAILVISYLAVNRALLLVELLR